MQLLPIFIVLAITAMSFMSGCSPKITILHQDPTHQNVRIRLDQKDKDTLDFGDKTSFYVSRGAHLIEAIPEGKKQCPWADDGKGWTIWVDRGAELTLLPPPKAASKKKKNPSKHLSNKNSKDKAEKKEAVDKIEGATNPY